MKKFVINKKKNKHIQFVDLDVLCSAFNGGTIGRGEFRDYLQ